MQEYYGTKKIQAEPAVQGQYEIEGYEVVYPDGYRSWSPKDVFEAAYRESGRMNFGHAHMALKEGRKMSRTGWSGKGLYVYRVAAREDSSGNGPSYRAFYELSTPSVEETLCTVSKWVPSVGDVEAEDWFIVESDTARSPSSSTRAGRTATRRCACISSE